MAERQPSSIIRVASFIANVGVGNRFTMKQLNASVPDVIQTDRRMRDLREMGWRIDNYKTNASLAPEEYLVREIGVRIDQGEKRPANQRRSIAGAKRRRIFERDGGACRICGVAGGQEFPDAHGHKAVLTIGHIVPKDRGGSDNDENLQIECQRCNEQSRNNIQSPPDPAEVLTAIRNLKGGHKTKKQVVGWMLSGKREISDAERAFGNWWRLPYDQRQHVKDALVKEVLSGE
ncbi:HNH endonuclease [Nocardia huaxiensis]|uniref:HNH endonuclease n=1 Tax=Nocardia huaxiensis TaxID=2755382 RepID=A0A7D6VCQ2_9NOCA|nr:HNH endonuclease [Nocardia huaxiensis]QLY33301.1 HNH endonuclease [Nocardia huaxiensis]